MNRSEATRQETMQQIDPTEPVESQIRKLNESYRNLYYRVQKIEKLLYELDDIVKTGVT